MKKVITWIATILFFTLLSTAFAEIKIFEREYTYQASEADSKLSCRAIKLNPKHTEAYFGCRFTYNELGNHQQAIRDMKIAARLGYKPVQDYLREQGIDWH
jgi:hypothetical protein